MAYGDFEKTIKNSENFLTLKTINNDSFVLVDNLTKTEYFIKNDDDMEILFYNKNNKVEVCFSHNI